MDSVKSRKRRLEESGSDLQCQILQRKCRRVKITHWHCMQLFSDTFTAPWTVACQAPLSMGFSRQEYWNELPFPPPQGLNAHLLSLLNFRGFFTCWAIGKSGMGEIINWNGIMREWGNSLVIQRSAFRTGHASGKWNSEENPSKAFYLFVCLILFCCCCF